MTVRNIVQSTFDEFGEASCDSKKSGSWYRRSDETVVVLNLQKSNYGPNYYVNVAVWLLAAGSVDAPKPSHCHIQTRLEALVPAELQKRLERLLDMESPIEDSIRHDALLSMMNQYLLPQIEVAETLESLRSGQGQQLVEASLVDGDGQRLLAEH